MNFEADSAMHSENSSVENIYNLQGIQWWSQRILKMSKHLEKE